MMGPTGRGFMSGAACMVRALIDDSIDRDRSAPDPGGAFACSQRPQGRAVNDVPTYETAIVPAHPAGGHSRSVLGTDTVVRLWGEQDAATSGQLARTVTGERTVLTGNVIVDFCDVTFVDASVISVLIVGRQAQSGRFAVTGLPHCARRLFALCNLLDVFADHDSISAEQAS